jgi:NTE family protein
MAEVLLEHGHRPDLLIGSSFGALNAAALAYDNTDLDHLRAAWLKIGRHSLFSSLGTAAVRGLAMRNSRQAREVRAILASALPEDGTAPIPGNLAIIASDLTDDEPVILRGGLMVDAVMASCTLPVLLPPVEHEGTLLLDGGLSAAAPVEEAVAVGAASVLLLDTGTSSVPDHQVEDLRWWQVAALAYNHQIRSQLKHSLGRVADKIPVAAISANVGSILDFGEPEEQFGAGRSAAAVALARDLRNLELHMPGVHGVFAKDRQP